MIVLHYTSSLDRSSGGTATYMQLLAKELGKITELHIATHRSVNPLKMDNCEVHYISSSLMGMGGMKRAWMELLDGIRPDIVHVNGCWLPAYAMTQRWAQAAGHKVVLTPHGMLEPWILRRHYWTRKLPALMLYQKKAVKQADAIHATAWSERDNLLRLGYNDKITVIPNGIDVDHIPIKSSWHRRKVLLFLSRVHRKKGINFLIEAVARLKERMRGYTVRIAGEGEEAYMDELKRLARSLGVEEIIRFEGGVYGDRKWELFRDADLFVLPTHSENFGIVVAEALASGTPVITTKGTPWRELESRHCGWWTEIGTDATTAALSAFLDTPDSELRAMGKRGRQLVEENYSAHKMAEDMVQLYEKVLATELAP